jgi:predicted nucleotidyltransferase
MRKQVYAIDDIKRIVEPIAISYGLGKLSLFGSYARGDATSESDMDFLFMEKGAVLSLFRVAGLQQALSEKLGAKVDVVAEDCLNEDFLEAIRDDEVILYES